MPEFGDLAGIGFLFIIALVIFSFMGLDARGVPGLVISVAILVGLASYFSK